MNNTQEKPEPTRDDLGWWRVADGKLPDDAITVRAYGHRADRGSLRAAIVPVSEEDHQVDAYLEDGTWYNAEAGYRMIITHWQDLPADPVDAGSFLEEPQIHA